MLNPEKLSTDITARAKAVANIVGTQAQVAVETATQGSAASFDFAHKLVDHGTAAAKSFAAVKSPTEFMQARDAFLTSSVNLFSGEMIASSERFFNALIGFTAWPGVLPKVKPAT